MIFGSTAKNINLLSLTMVAIAYGLVSTKINFSLYNISLSIISFYILNIMGVWMTLHRYYSHRSFEFRHRILENIFLFISILAGRGSTLSWVYIHRQHHAHSDTDLNPRRRCDKGCY